MMEYQKIINFRVNTLNQWSKVRTKKLVKVNDDLLEMYNTNSQIKLKTLVLRSGLCDYSDVYILGKGTISIAAQAGGNPNKANKNCAPFTDCISQINNKQIDDANHIYYFCQCII